LKSLNEHQIILPAYESSYVDSSYDDSSIFDRDDSLRENGTLSGDTRHQFSVHHCDIYIIYKQKIAENIHYIHFSIQIVLISDKNWPKPFFNRDFKWNILAFNDMSYDDDSVFERDESLIENGNLSVLKRSNLKSTNQTIKTGNIIQLMTFN
jgi:hypothetical protein